MAELNVAAYLKDVEKRVAELARVLRDEPTKVNVNNAVRWLEYMGIEARVASEALAEAATEVNTEITRLNRTHGETVFNPAATSLLRSRLLTK